MFVCPYLYMYIIFFFYAPFLVSRAGRLGLDTTRKRKRDLHVPEGGAKDQHLLLTPTLAPQSEGRPPHAILVSALAILKTQRRVRMPVLICQLFTLLQAA